MRTADRVPRFMNTRRGRILLTHVLHVHRRHVAKCQDAVDDPAWSTSHEVMKQAQDVGIIPVNTSHAEVTPQVGSIFLVHFYMFRASSQLDVSTPAIGRDVHKGSRVGVCSTEHISDGAAQYV